MTILIFLRKYYLTFLGRGFVLATVGSSIRVKAMQNAQGHVVSSDKLFIYQATLNSRKSEILPFHDPLCVMDVSGNPLIQSEN